MARIKIPSIPTKDVRFDRGRLCFKILEGCAYCPEADGFTGGDWVNARLRSKEGNPIVIYLDGSELIVYEHVYNGKSLGFMKKEIIRINVCD